MSLSLDKNDITARINKISSIEELEKLRIEYIGKKGFLSNEMQSLSLLSIEEKKIKGQELNLFKSFFEQTINNKKSDLEISALNEKLENEQNNISRKAALIRFLPILVCKMFQLAAGKMTLFLKRYPFRNIQNTVFFPEYRKSRIGVSRNLQKRVFRTVPEKNYHGMFSKMQYFIFSNRFCIDILQRNPFVEGYWDSQLTSCVAFSTLVQGFSY